MLTNISDVSLFLCQLFLSLITKLLIFRIQLYYFFIHLLYCALLFNYLRISLLHLTLQMTKGDLLNFELSSEVGDLRLLVSCCVSERDDLIGVFYLPWHLLIPRLTQQLVFDFSVAGWLLVEYIPAIWSVRSRSIWWSDPFNSSVTLLHTRILVTLLPSLNKQFLVDLIFLSLQVQVFELYRQILLLQKVLDEVWLTTCVLESVGSNTSEPVTFYWACDGGKQNGFERLLFKIWSSKDIV